MSDDHTSEDFMQFSNEDLIQELCRRSLTLILAMEIESKREVDDDDDSDNKIRVFHSGDIFARAGMSQVLSTHIRRMACSMLDDLE